MMSSAAGKKIFSTADISRIQPAGRPWLDRPARARTPGGTVRERHGDRLGSSAPPRCDDVPLIQPHVVRECRQARRRSMVVRRDASDDAVRSPSGQLGPATAELGRHAATRVSGRCAVGAGLNPSACSSIRASLERLERAAHQRIEVVAGLQKRRRPQVDLAAAAAVPRARPSGHRHRSAECCGSPRSASQTR